MKLYVDDVRRLPLWAKDDGGWTVVRTYGEALNRIKTGKVTEISLDHDLGGAKTGYDLLKEITRMVHDGEIHMPEAVYFHTGNPVGAKNMAQLWERFKEKYNAPRRNS